MTKQGWVLAGSCQSQLAPATPGLVRSSSNRAGRCQALARGKPDQAYTLVRRGEHFGVPLGPNGQRDQPPRHATSTQEDAWALNEAVRPV